MVCRGHSRHRHAQRAAGYESNLTGGRFGIDLAGVCRAAPAYLRSSYDPKSERVKADVSEIRVVA
jgi:hypothetical protein